MNSLQFLIHERSHFTHQARNEPRPTHMKTDATHVDALSGDSPPPRPPDAAQKVAVSSDATAVCVGAKRTSREQEEWCAQKKRERQDNKLHYTFGGLTALTTRTCKADTHSAECGANCLPDAGYNALHALGFAEASQETLRKRSIFERDGVREASWASFKSALSTLEYPFELVEVTSRFRVKGGLMMNLLTAPAGAYLVALCITVDGKHHRHCVLLSTFAEKTCPLGKLVDNHGEMEAMRLEEEDRLNKTSAKDVWKRFAQRNPALDGLAFTVDIAEVYALGSASK